MSAETYTYKGISAGKYVEGTIEAINQDEASFKLKEQKDLVKDYLSDGAKKVRPLAQEFIEEIRSKIGIS